MMEDDGIGANVDREGIASSELDDLKAMPSVLKPRLSQALLVEKATYTHTKRGSLCADSGFKTNGECIGG